MKEWLGDLWHFPFWADAWGTAADWFGAVGTVAGVATAVGYYIYSHRRDEKLQAQQVVAMTNCWKDDTYIVDISNLSDKPIFDVTPVQTRRPFSEVLTREYQRRGRPPTAKEIDPLRKAWEATSGGIFQATSLKTGYMKPGESKEIQFRDGTNPAEWYGIVFRDCMSRLWELEVDTDGPKAVYDDRHEYEVCPKWHIIWHPRCAISKWCRQAKISRWAKKNIKSSPAISERHTQGGTNAGESIGSSVDDSATPDESTPSQ